MYKTIEIKIPIESHYQKNAEAIFCNDLIVTQPSEFFLNYMDSYQPQALQNNDDVFHILFNGKKIKQAILDKKTLLTIKKLNSEKICAVLQDIHSLEINQYNYPIEKVENLILCDLMYTKGGIFAANEIHAAVFFPYFLEKAEQHEKVTLIFANIVFERFKIVAKSIFYELGFTFYIDGNAYDLVHITKEDFCRWLTLHEYIHNSGPLSLFRSNANKFATKPYGFIEEMRVDLTSIKLILMHMKKDQDPQLLNIMIIILLERLFRGALYNYHPEWKCDVTGMLAKEVEGDVSISLFYWLYHHSIIDICARKIHLHLTTLDKLIDVVLEDIYKYEQLAHDKHAFNVTALKFAEFFRNKHIFIHPEVTDFLNQFAVQDCQYFIKFECI